MRHYRCDMLIDMITDADVVKLKQVFATKDELVELRSEIRVGFGDIGDKMDAIATAVARIDTTNDKYSGSIQDLRTENSMGSIHLARHDRQIDALALATHTTLPS